MGDAPGAAGDCIGAAQGIAARHADDVDIAAVAQTPHHARHGKIGGDGFKIKRRQAGADDAVLAVAGEALAQHLAQFGAAGEGGVAGRGRDQAGKVVGPLP